MRTVAIYECTFPSPPQFRKPSWPMGVAPFQALGGGLMIGRLPFIWNHGFFPKFYLSLHSDIEARLWSAQGVVGFLFSGFIGLKVSWQLQHALKNALCRIQICLSSVSLRRRWE